MLNKLMPQTVRAKLLVLIGFSFFLLVGGIVASVSSTIKCRVKTP